jgi:hypothetical protein
MRWECTECGYSSEEQKVPRVCVCCGTAGGFFVEAEIGIEGDATAETIFDSWLHRGMARADLPPHHRRRHHTHHHHRPLPM